MTGFATMKSLLYSLRPSTLYPFISRPKFPAKVFPNSPLSFAQTQVCMCCGPSSSTTVAPHSVARKAVLDRSDLMAGSSSTSGEIHVICGPMFAGKTTALLRRVQSECDNGRKVAIIKSDKDLRYGLDSIVTHDGLKMPCWALPNLLTFRMKVGAEEYEQLDVIGIDEAQFFDDLYDFCRKAADHDGKTVIVAGLDGDYLRNFGSVIDIIPLADSVTKLTARCELCDKRALFTLRKTEETQTELIGGADVYMPVCRDHYVRGQVIVEAARSVLESQNVVCHPALATAAVPV